MKKSLGVVSAIVSNRKKCAMKVNQVFTQHGHIIMGRMGLPYPKKKCWVITVIVDSTPSELNALASKLSKIQGVCVKAS